MAAFEFIKDGQRLILSYTPHNGDGWLWDQYKSSLDGRISIGRAFSFPMSHVLKTGQQRRMADDIADVDYTWEFLLGVMCEEEYYRIAKDVLGLKCDCLIHKDVKLSGAFFLSRVGGVPLLQKIDGKIGQSIIIGGAREDAIPESVYANMRKTWPSRYWVGFYVECQIERQLSEFCDVKGDAETRFERYLNKKREDARSVFEAKNEKFPAYKEFEIQKYEYIRNRMKELLEGSLGYSEDEWCKLIMEFILILYPRYIQALYKVTIPCKKEDGSDAQKQLDVVLLDSDGHIDIIEIKKPNAADIFSRGNYRGNKYPGHTLSGTVMQMESYLYHLRKGGYVLEDYINKHCRGRLLPDLKISVVNPKGILILGRSNDFDNKQKLDFEIIRRKYASIIDILTYDDLLRRLSNVIDGIKKR